MSELCPLCMNPLEQELEVTEDAVLYNELVDERAEKPETQSSDRASGSGSS